MRNELFTIAALVLFFGNPALAQKKEQLELAISPQVVAIGVELVKKAGIDENLRKLIHEKTGNTLLVAVSNNTRYDLRLWKIDSAPFKGNFREEQTVKPKKSGKYGDGGMGIPWCDDADQFKEKHMVVELAVPGSGEYKRLAMIWQDEGTIKLHPGDKFDKDAKPMPGIQKGGGELKMVVSENTKGKVGVYLTP